MFQVWPKKVFLPRSLLSSSPRLITRRVGCPVMHWPRDFSSRGDKSVSAKLLPSSSIAHKSLFWLLKKKGVVDDDVTKLRQFRELSLPENYWRTTNRSKLFCSRRKKGHLFLFFSFHQRRRRSDNLSRTKTSREKDFYRYLFSPLPLLFFPPKRGKKRKYSLIDRVGIFLFSRFLAEEENVSFFPLKFPPFCSPTNAVFSSRVIYWNMPRSEPSLSKRRFAAVQFPARGLRLSPVSTNLFFGGIEMTDKKEPVGFSDQRRRKDLRGGKRVLSNEENSREWLSKVSCGEKKEIFTRGATVI